MSPSQWTVDYELELDLLGEDILRMRLRTERGRVVDFVVQYEAKIQGQFYLVVRYDGSHGRGHRDLLDHQGRLIEGGKQWFPEHLTLGEVAVLGEEDIKSNWRLYRRDFLWRMR